MTMRIPSQQQGITMIVALIMLVLLTLLVITAYNLSSSNLKSVGNMQHRTESIAAANAAIENELTTFFTTSTLKSYNTLWEVLEAFPKSVSIDIDHNNKNDYSVLIARPACVRATQAISDVHSSVTLGPGWSSSPYFNTIWDFDATVTELHGSGASVRVRQGIRMLLPKEVADHANICSST
jgi:Tfp pilus assembly protein PilX